jgi:hypothetical protein
VPAADGTTISLRRLLPYVQQVYRLFRAEDKVANAHFGDEGHDYGPSKRQAAYRFLARHLGLALENVTDTAGEIQEDVTIEDNETLYVFDSQHPLPPHAKKNNDEATW